MSNPTARTMGPGRNATPTVGGMGHGPVGNGAMSWKREEHTERMMDGQGLWAVKNVIIDGTVSHITPSLYPVMLNNPQEASPAHLRHHHVGLGPNVDSP